MTREQAIEIEVKSAREWAHFGAHFGHVSDEDILRAASQTIDGYVALGMLKLDEPKSECWDVKPRVVDALKGAYVGGTLRQPLGEGDVHYIIGWLENAGLRIVEK